MPSAGPAAAAAPAEAAEEVEKPKEKTIFTVKLEKFDAGAKAKIIREVKAIMPNMNLVEVSLSFVIYLRRRGVTNDPGKEVRRVRTPDLEGELAKGGSREIAKDLDGSRSYHLVIIGAGRLWLMFMHCSPIPSLPLLHSFPVFNLCDY
jgi:hypothetical protein